MKEIMHAILFGFKEILTWNTMKRALVIGLLVTVFWAGVGFVFWENIISFGAKVVELVPFSMVRSNGAWMLFAFAWLQLVLITFALIFAFFGNMILRTVSKERYTSFSLIVIAISAIFWSTIWFFNADVIYNQLLKLLTWLPFETVEKSIGFLLGFYLIYSAIIATMVVLVSLFSKPLLSNIQKRAFPELSLVKTNLFSSMRYTLKDALIYLLISLIALPLLFVPILNLTILLLLWVWLMKDTFRYDAASLLFEKVDKERIKEHRSAIWIISFVAALFNFVPVLNLFGPFFGEIAMFHYFVENHTHQKGV
jgi:hypothetical protein